MLCPLLPGNADDSASVRQPIEFGLSCGAEEVFVEPVNAGGPGLKATEAVLREAGFGMEADAAPAVRHQCGWSSYVTRLLNHAQEGLRKSGALDKLRFLLCPWQAVLARNSLGEGQRGTAGDV